MNETIANPPYGKDWKRDAEAVEAEHERGVAGRFAPGLPRISDGQLLFLLHMLAHANDPKEGGSRIAIIDATRSTSTATLTATRRPGRSRRSRPTSGSHRRMTPVTLDRASTCRRMSPSWLIISQPLVDYQPTIS
jgi:hypothetical protein